GTGGKVTWRFRARDVRDFAFAASSRYLWRAARIPVPGITGGVAMHVLNRPGAAGWDSVPGFLRHTMEFYSRELIPYAYPQITAVEGPVAGMEHPQLIFIGRVDDVDVMRYLVIHEAGHEWFPMMVQQDEAAYAWMDEGLNTYYDERAQHAARPDSDFHAESRASYLQLAGTRNERALSTHIDQVSGAAWGVTAYQKPAVLTRALRSVVGDETFERTMRAYARDWLFRHPTPWDFFNAFEREHGADLDWLWHPWWHTTRTLDQAIARVEPVAGAVRVTVEDRGRIAVPTRLLVTMEGGATARAEIPVERWLEGGTLSVTVDVPAAAPVVRVEIDPEHWFPDVRPANNVWPAAAESPAP
ncbi:MAG TPA: M1 family aminopeptidase, partial [Longimicrobium sp.]|nr:M1 family aminopeptidase [Longimicrobium sp.]